ncbi:unnamed protein product [Ceutorhynchus assimilis]|uniref:Uncharacterized protein n=1 Tax=Ceutorhynchus assimilis TaxID=467358 RepID=A0A9N9QMG8_9CUCU|nr:unnamed protein product [Ceutorhynchus assimilis]
MAGNQLRTGHELSLKRGPRFALSFQDSVVSNSSIFTWRSAGTNFSSCQKCLNKLSGCKPTALEDENHPDWVPSQNLEHQSQIFYRKPEDVERIERLNKRRRLKGSDEQQIGHEKTDTNVLSEARDQDEVETGTASQTELTMDELCVKFEQLSFAARKMEVLQKKIGSFAIWSQGGN